MSRLPPGWADTTVGDVTTYVSRGKSPKYAEKSSLPVVNQKAIRWHGLQNEYLKFVHPDQFEQWTEERFIKAGDILWNSTGTGTIGRACLVCTEHLNPPKVVDSHVTIVRPNPEVTDPRFLFAWIRGPEVQDGLEELASGSTNQIELNRSTVVATKVPLAPLLEQKRIAAKLDALLARVDACRTRLDRVPTILKRLRQSILAAATSGELTKDWREQREIESPWVSAHLADLGELGRGKSKHRPRNDPQLYGGRYPFIQTGDVAQSGGRIESHSQTYSAFGLAQSRLWPAGTVCITIAANIADTAILTYPACFPDSVVGFVADPSRVLPEFVKWSIDVISEKLEAFAPATAQKNINLAVLNEVEIRCPTLEEQVEIVRRTVSLLDAVRTLERRLTVAAECLERLTPSALSKAFRGELVLQDPNDEPASALLERIGRAGSSSAGRPIPGRQRKLRARKELDVAMKKLIDVLADAGDWMDAQEAFRACGITGGADTDLIEGIYSELRELERGKRVIVKAVKDGKGRKLLDRLKLAATA